MDVSRRSFIAGALASPAVILTPGLLMPVKALEIPKLVAPGSHVAPGSIRFNTTTLMLDIWDGVAWRECPRARFAMRR